MSDPSASLIHLLEGALARSSQRPGEVRAASESSPSQQAVRLMRRSVGAVRMLWVRALSRLWTAVAEEA